MSSSPTDPPPPIDPPDPAESPTSATRLADDEAPTRERTDTLESAVPAASSDASSTALAAAPPNPPAPPRAARGDLEPALASWLERLRQSVEDLARSQQALDARLSAVVALVEARVRDDDAAARDALPLALPAGGWTFRSGSDRRPLALARRVARVVRGVRHRPVETVDRTVDASAQIEDLPRLVEIEALDATDATSGALPEAEVTLPGQIGWLRRGRDGRAEVLDLAGGRLPDAALPAEVIVVRGNAPAGWLDLAALVLAAEGLELCVGRPGEVFAARLSRDAVEAPLEVAVRARWTAGARRARRGARTLRWRRAADRLRSRPAAVLGRMLPLGDDAPTPGAWSERLGLRALPAPGGSFDLLPAGAPAAHRRVVSAGHWPHGPRVASDGPRREAILLSTPLNADLARWLSAEIAALERPPVLLSLAREEHAAARSLRDLLPATPWLVPLGRLHPAERAPLAAAILERHDVQRILHVGPGDGVFDHPVLHAALDTRSVRDLAIGVGPLADPTPRPADVIRLQPTTPEHPRLERADAGAIERPFSRRAARHALGLDTEDRVLVGVFDLTAAARPEDFVELLARLALCDPRWRGVLVGRGPLAGTVADLVQLHALGQLLVAPSLDPLLALCAADVVVSTAEHRPLLGALSDAARLGLPIVATDDGSPDHRAEPLPIGSHRVAPGDLDALVAAVTSSAAERAI